MKELEQAELTGGIIGCAISVHREPGPGFLESVYEAAMAVELGRQGLRFERQKPVYISYQGIAVGERRLDDFVKDQIVVELKAVNAFEDIHFAIVRLYLKAIARRHGLLLNFAMHPLAVRRGIFDPERSAAA